MMQISLDSKHDVLYVGIGDRSNSYGDETDDGLVILKDLKTDRVTGVTIMDFMRRYKNDTLSRLPMPFPLDFKKDVIDKLQ